ncbi:hypothetical protein BDW60DRAFT_173705 [Aspergillus nidulans var. acristatus]
MRRSARVSKETRRSEGILFFLSFFFFLFFLFFCCKDYRHQKPVVYPTAIPANPQLTEATGTIQEPG